MLAFGMACAAYDSNDCRAMLTIEHTIPESVSPSAEHPEGVPLHFTGGLLGFETNKQFELISDDELKPFQWLKGMDADQSFLVIPPAFVVVNYSVEISDDDVALLGIRSPEDARVICIATYHPNETVTVNLKGPIIFNQQTGEARQIVPLNATELSISHPMGN